MKKTLKNKKSFTSILLILIILILTFSSNQSLAKYNVLKVDIEIDKNPIDCGDEATVTVTVYLEEGDDIPNYGDLRIGLVESDGPNTTILDKNTAWIPALTNGPNSISFKVKCQSKDAGCQLWGPSGNSDESKAWIFAYIYNVGEKSPKIHVQCKQTNMNGEISIEGSETSTLGSITNIIMNAAEPINNVYSANWSIHYDSSIFEVKNVKYIFPPSLYLITQGLLTYQDKPNENKIDFSMNTNLTPILFEGDIFLLQLQTKNQTDKIWQETFIKCTEDSKFYTENNEEINVCTGGNQSIFILPTDTTPPEINPTLIDFSQGLITGQTGAITDENYGYLKDYIKISLYNSEGKIIAEENVNSDGSFKLGPFFWLNKNLNSTLTATNGASLYTSYSFIPNQISIPYVYSLNDTTGKINETITIQYYIQSRSDNPETYNISITDTQNWDYEQNNFQITLEPMQEKILSINVSIPKNTENKSTNTIYLSMTSNSNNNYSSNDNIKVNVNGEYTQPQENDKKDETPGFEISILLISLAIFIFLKKHRKNK